MATVQRRAAGHPLEPFATGLAHLLHRAQGAAERRQGLLHVVQGCVSLPNGKQGGQQHCTRGVGGGVVHKGHFPWEGGGGAPRHGVALQCQGPRCGVGDGSRKQVQVFCLKVGGPPHARWQVQKVHLPLPNTPPAPGQHGVLVVPSEHGPTNTVLHVPRGPRGTRHVGIQRRRHQHQSRPYGDDAMQRRSCVPWACLSSTVHVGLVCAGAQFKRGNTNFHSPVSILLFLFFFHG